MKIKFNKLFGILSLSGFIIFSMESSLFAIKSSVCHEADGIKSFLVDKSFKCFKCGKWFDDSCLNALALKFGCKPVPENYICWVCSGWLDEMPYDKLGFDKDGVHKDTGRKLNKDGYDVNGFNRRGIHKITGTKFNPQGFDQNGCDITGKPVLKKICIDSLGF